MKIVIDISPLFLGHKTRGIGRYTRELAEWLKKTGPDNKIILTGRIDSVNKPDVVHYPYFDLFHSHLPVIAPSPLEVVTIHDLTPLRMKEIFKPGIRSGFNLWLQKKLIKRVSAVITDSRNSKNDIIELLSIPADKIYVVPLGVRSEFRPAPKNDISEAREKYRLPNDYLLYVGDINVNKNLPVLFRTLTKISNLSLVLVSQAFKQSRLREAQELRQTILELGIKDKVFILPDVPLDPPDDLISIYSGAVAYVQPSLYEGFGLPVLEAMACGTPVVSSNRSSLPEVAGEAGLLVSPNEDFLVEAIRKVMSDPKIRLEMRQKGLLRAKNFTWEKTAKMTLSIYEKLISRVKP